MFFFNVLDKTCVGGKSQDITEKCVLLTHSIPNNVFISVVILLSPGSVQETTQMQIKLQQAQSAKALSENMNKVLQVCSLMPL